MNPGKKVFQQKPPDKGSFPLDHDGKYDLNFVVTINCSSKNNKVQVTGFL